MARKQTVNGGKRNEIIEVALRLFPENGYDGTTVRMIQRKLGSEVGLFYYYSKTRTSSLTLCSIAFLTDISRTVAVS